MEKGNILLIGNSGVGKSTLINAILGEELVETGYGTEGITKEVKVYENDAVPFRLIDSIGFEPSWLKAKKAIDEVKKWSKGSAKKGQEEKQINVIWFCVDGTSRKLFGKTISDLSKATSIWKTVPVIVVITKSYSTPEREENIKMVEEAFAKQRGKKKNVRKIIPVVAATFTLNDTAFASPEGITELIDETNLLLPEGLKAAENDIADYKLKRKQVMAHSIVSASIVAGTTIGAVPIPFADGLLLAPLEIAEVKGIARVYGIEKNDTTNSFINRMIGVGTVGAAAKALISGIKSIPGINIGAAALNAIIAGSMVGALGEGATYIFEQIYLGNKSTNDVDWMQKIMDAKFGSKILDKANKALSDIQKNPEKDAILNAIKDIVAQ